MTRAACQSRVQKPSPKMGYPSLSRALWNADSIPWNHAGIYLQLANLLSSSLQAKAHLLSFQTLSTPLHVQ